jgi:ANTAR domain/GAF domain
MTIDSKSLTVFVRDQGIYLFIAFVVGAIFWAIGQPINPFTVMLYSLCVGIFVSPPVQWLHALYEKPSPYDRLIFLTVLGVVMLPVYALSTVWKYSGDRSIEQSRLPIGHGYVGVLSEHLQPIAVSQGVGTAPQVRDFSAWSTHPGETSVWIPLVARSRLLGALHLQHRDPRPYSRRECNLLSSIGRILGTDIRISQSGSENSDLLLQLETRKLVERGKGILQRDLGLSEEEAYLVLERKSRQKCRPMKEVAQAIILSDEVRRSSLQPE